MIVRHIEHVGSKTLIKCQWVNIVNVPFLIDIKQDEIEFPSHLEHLWKEFKI